jgi:hypothetical protein
MGLYDRCITPRHSQLDDAAGIRQPLRHHAEPGLVVIRYEMIHEARSSRWMTPARKGRGKYISAMRAAGGRQHAGCRDDELSCRRPHRRRHRARRDDRAIHRVSPTVVEWRVTFEDPNTWTRPWTYVMALTKVDYSQQVFEYACHEGNHAMRNILSAARAAEK